MSFSTLDAKQCQSHTNQRIDEAEVCSVQSDALGLVAGYITYLTKVPYITVPYVRDNLEAYTTLNICHLVVYRVAAQPIGSTHDHKISDPGHLFAPACPLSRRFLKAYDDISPFLATQPRQAPAIHLQAHTHSQAQHKLTNLSVAQGAGT